MPGNAASARPRGREAVAGSLAPRLTAAAALSRGTPLAIGLGCFSLAVVVVLIVLKVPLIQEDGFYYLRIAEHLAAGQGSTFDGLNRTNGYHPLWLLLLVPVFWLAPSPEAAMTLAVLLQGALLALGAVLLYLTARRDVGELAASLTALLWFGLVWGLSLSGLEFALHGCLLLALAYSYRRWFWPRSPDAWRTSFGLGLLLGLAFLARLETLLLSACLAVALALREARRPDRAAGIRMLALLSPLAASVALYLATNLLFFDLAVPVSSLVKRAWSDHLLAHDPRFLEGGFWPAKAQQLVGALPELRGWPLRAVLLGSLGATLSWRVLPSLRPYGPFVAFSALQVLGYLLALHGQHSLTRWYYAIQPILAALLVGGLADALADGGGRRDLAAAWRGPGRWLAAAAWCAVPLATLRSAEGLVESSRSAPKEPLYLAARWARENLPREARIGTWNAGAIGFLSRRQVVNLDGVVNSREFFQTRRHDLCRYWDEIGLTHLLDVFPAREGARMRATPLAAPSYEHCLDRLELLWEAGNQGDSGRAKAFRIRSQHLPAAGR